MPIVLNVSKHLHDALGDDVANEIAEWFNKLDVAFRQELRESVDLNFARFDSRLEQRIAELRAELRAELKSDIGQLRADLGQLRGELIKWAFVFFAGAALAVIGLR